MLCLSPLCHVGSRREAFVLAHYSNVGCANFYLCFLDWSCLPQVGRSGLARLVLPFGVCHGAAFLGRACGSRANVGRGVGKSQGRSQACEAPSGGRREARRGFLAAVRFLLYCSLIIYALAGYVAEPAANFLKNSGRQRHCPDKSEEELERMVEDAFLQVCVEELARLTDFADPSDAAAMKKAASVVEQRRLTVWARDTMRRECAPVHAASSCAWRNSGSRYRRAFDQQQLAPATRRRRECELGGSEFVGAVSTVASGCTRMCLWQNCGKRRAHLGAPRMRGTAASRGVLLHP